MTAREPPWERQILSGSLCNELMQVGTIRSKLRRSDTCSLSGESVEFIPAREVRYVF
jgi:hypothetical protein